MISNLTLDAPVTQAEAITKVESYCAYQERSTYEVRNKLKTWDLTEPDIEIIISHLLEENFLNEERFAEAYTLGKFRIKGWGKLKIKQALKLKRVSPEIITKSLKKIDDKAYISRIKHLLERKSSRLTEKIPYKRHQKLAQYAITKGFEQEVIFKLLTKI